MQHDEDRQGDLNDEEDDVEDDQHEGGPARPLHPAVGCQQAGLNLLSLPQGLQQESIEYRD